jgi:hypothetical protein
LAGEVSELRLEGESVRLDPTGTADAAALLAAASEDRSSYGYTLVPATIEEAEAYVANALAERDERWSVPFTVRRRSDGAVLGTSRFLDLAYWPDDGAGASGVAPSVGEVGARDGEGLVPSVGVVIPVEPDDGSTG